MENREIVSNAINFIRCHATQSDLSVEDVAKNAGFSMDYFNTIFLSATGFNIMEYIRYERLRYAAQKMSGNPSKKILELALECGYDSHESFSRAFKKQYGYSPSEYRRRLWKEAHCPGDCNFDGFSQRLIDEFPTYKIIDRNEAVEFLLKKDPLRYAIYAIRIRRIGGCILCDGENLSDGFIWFVDIGATNILTYFFTDDYDKLAGWVKTFSAPRFQQRFDSTHTKKDLESELRTRSITFDFIMQHEHWICNHRIQESKNPTNLFLRELHFADHDLITTFLMSIRYDYSSIQWINYSLKKRDEMGIEHPILLYGAFDKEKLIGVAHCSVHRTHGNLVNESIHVHLADHRPSVKKEYQWIFTSVTNRLIERGILCFESSYAKLPKFNATAFEYETASHLFLFPTDDT